MPASFLEPEYADAYAAYRAAPGPGASDRLVAGLAPAIDAGVRKHLGASATPSLRRRARHMTLDAVRTYDPSRGPLGTHVINSLQGLKRVSMKQQQMLSAPQRVLQDHYALRQARDRLADDLGREPSDAELSDASGLPPRRIAKVRRFRPGFAQGQLERTVATADGEEADVAPAVARPEPIRGLVQFLYHDVDAVDQAILENHFGLNGRTRRLSGVELARRLNLSSSALSQRAARLQAQLDELGALGGR